jgi:hypothetical protein
MADAGSPQAGQGQIIVKTKFFFLAFLLLFFKPRLHLDGGPPVQVQWGETTIPVPPGHHQVRAYVPYLFLSTMGDSTTDVDVPPGGTVRLQWYAPLLVFLKGHWTTLA